jgi:hypothetical protein
VRVISGKPVANVDLSAIARPFDRAEVHFEGLVPPAESFELRVFVGEPARTVEPAGPADPHYIGSQFMYGTGPRGSPGPGAGQDSRDPQQFAATEIRLNVTDRLRALLDVAHSGSVPLVLVAVDRNGEGISDPGLMIQNVLLVTS